MELSGAHIVWECVEREGVRTVFGTPGANLLALRGALQDHQCIRLVPARHEQGACHMADGFSRAGGPVGVVLAASGPGAASLVTGRGSVFKMGCGRARGTAQARQGKRRRR